MKPIPSFSARRAVGVLGLALCALLHATRAQAAADIVLPKEIGEIGVTAEVVRAERDGLWEKSLVVRFTTPRRTLSTSDGMLDANAVVNHAAHPKLWEKLGADGKPYTERTRVGFAD